MDPLASITDLAARLPDGTISDEARATTLLADASGAVRRYTGQTFTEETTTDRLKVHKNKVRLPQRPVTAVTSVKDINGTTIVYTRVREVLHLDTVVPDTWAWEPRRTALGYVDVNYTHGHPDGELPDDLIGFVCQIVGRAYGTPATESGTSQESLGAYAYSTGAAAASGVFGLLTDEKAWLDAFIHHVGVIYVGQ